MIRKRKTKNGNRFTAIVFVNQNEDGTMNRLFGKARETMREAKQDEAELMALAEIQRQTKGAKPTCYREAIARFKESKKYLDYESRTKEDFEYYEKKELLPVFGDAKLSSVNALVLESWLEDMATHSARATFMKPYNFMKNVIKFCRKHDWILSDPTEGVDIPADDPKRKETNKKKKAGTWTPEQIDAFMSYRPVIEDDIYPMLLLSFHLGLRPGEVCGIKEKDISLRSVRIEQGLSRTNHETKLKTETSHRELPLSKDIAIQLLKYCHGNGDNYIWINQRGNPFTPEVFSDHFRKLLRKYNSTHGEQLPVMPLYNARHSWNTNAIFVQNLDPHVRASVMGHKSPDTSSKHYTRVSQDEMRKQLYG